MERISHPLAPPIERLIDGYERDIQKLRLALKQAQAGLLRASEEHPYDYMYDLKIIREALEQNEKTNKTPNSGM